MKVEQVKDAETPDEMRAEINRMAIHDALTHNAMNIADRNGLSGEDRYTMLAYFALVAKQLGRQRELDAMHSAPIKYFKEPPRRRR